MKSSIDRLTVFGGVPAFAENLHVGRPNIGDRQRLLDAERGLYQGQGCGPCPSPRPIRHLSGPWGTGHALERQGGYIENVALVAAGTRSRPWLCGCPRRGRAGLAACLLRIPGPSVSSNSGE
jgi:hypothetical protein